MHPSFQYTLTFLWENFENLNSETLALNKIRRIACDMFHSCQLRKSHRYIRKPNNNPEEDDPIGIITYMHLDIFTEKEEDEGDVVQIAQIANFLCALLKLPYITCQASAADLLPAEMYVAPDLSETASQAVEQSGQVITPHIEFPHQATVINFRPPATGAKTIMEWLALMDEPERGYAMENCFESEKSRLVESIEEALTSGFPMFMNPGIEYWRAIHLKYKDTTSVPLVGG